MATDHAFSHVGAEYRVEFTSNGTPRGTACAYRLTDAAASRQSIVAPTEINVLSEHARARWIARHPEDAQDEIRGLVERIAQDYHAAKRPGRAPAATPASEDQWPNPVNGRVLLTDLVALVRTHVVLREPQALAVALWVVHTHCLAATDYTPYLWVRSATPECGKSTLLELLARLAYRPLTLLNTSVAFLFRRIDEDQCTVFFDEIDTQLRGEQFWAVSNILNAGFKRGQIVGRMEKRADGVLDPKEYRVFGPKALGGIGRRVLADTTASRTIRIDLRKATQEELKGVVRRGDSELDALCVPYRQRIARWGTDHVDELREHRPEIPHELLGRPADITGILLAIADIVGSEWPRLARSAIASLYGRSGESQNLRVVLLHDLKALFLEQDTDFMGSSEACIWLRAREAGPWAEFGRGGHGLTPKGLADLLEDFDIHPEKNRERGNRRGYFRNQFRLVWEAYPDNAQGPEPSAPTAPSANTIPLNTLVGSASKAIRGPQMLRSGSGADAPRPNSPVKAVLQRELALGADRAV